MLRNIVVEILEGDERLYFGHNNRAAESLLHEGRNGDRIHATYAYIAFEFRIRRYECRIYFQRVRQKYICLLYYLLLSHTKLGY